MKTPWSLDYNSWELDDIDSVDAATDVIQSKIDQLLQCRNRLRSLHNSLLPIARIPPEVLSILVFPYCIDGASQADTQKYRPYLAVSQVSRQWRRIALDNRWLWTKPDFSRRKIAAMMHERSRDAPLSIFFDSNMRSLPSDVVDAQYRVRDLHFRGSSDRLKPELSRCLSAKWLAELETLCIEIYRSGDLIFQNPNLEQCKIPRLKSIKLDCFTLSWIMPGCKSLTSLSLNLHSWPSGDHLSYFAAFLRQNPLLTDLQLSALGSTQPNVSLLSQPVKLPRLTQLTVKDSTCYLCYILLAIQPSAELSSLILTFGNDNNFHVDAADLYPRVWAWLRATQLHIDDYTVDAVCWTPPPQWPYTQLDLESRPRRQIFCYSPAPSSDKTRSARVHFKWVLGQGTASLDIATSAVEIARTQQRSKLILHGTDYPYHELSNEFWQSVSLLPSLAVLDLRDLQKFSLPHGLVVNLDLRDRVVTFPRLQYLLCELTSSRTWERPAHTVASIAAVLQHRLDLKASVPEVNVRHSSSSHSAKVFGVNGKVVEEYS